MRTGQWKRLAGTKHDSTQCAVCRVEGWATEGEGEWIGPGGEGFAWKRDCREHRLEAIVVAQPEQV